MSDRIHNLRRHLPAGAGLGLRRELWHQTLDAADEIDFVEIIIDDFLDYPLREVKRTLAPVLERFDVVAHGVCLSVGSVDGLDEDYVERVARLLDALGLEIYSEHLSFRRGGAHEVAQFVPVPFSEAWAVRVAANVRRVQQITGRTLILENVTYLLGHIHAGIGEANFVRRVLELGDCAMLLDVTNLLINAANLGAHPSEYLQTLPAERIVLAHIAGGHDDGELYIDSHSSQAPPEAIELLRRVAGGSGLRAAALERDKSYPETIEPLLDELVAIRGALAASETISGGPAAPELPALTVVEQPEVVNIDPVDPSRYQATLAALLVEPGAWRSLREGGKLPDVEFPDGELPDGDSPDEQTEILRSYLLSFPPNRVRAFAKILRYKRRENIESLLHGTCQMLGDALATTLGAYFRRRPEQGLSRLEDAVGFAVFVEEQEDLSRAVRSMATHERIVGELSARPYRFWDVIRRRRRAEIYYEPRVLSEAAHSNHSLPEPPSEPLLVRYTRLKKGVWVDILADARSDEEII
jgi:uncharacterized protein (UPF0276 family)